jgi:hypothetical protein
MRLKLAFMPVLLAAIVAVLTITPTAAPQAPEGIPLDVRCLTTAPREVVPCTAELVRFTTIRGVTNAVIRFTSLGNTQILQVPIRNVRTRECPILDLRLGPLNLDLLGLVVRTNRIHLEIVAQPGPGNLLGNLLCSLAGLLDRGPLTQLLNGLLRSGAAQPA